MKKRLLLTLMPFFLIACKNEAPNCSDSETIALVKEIAQDELDGYVKASQVKMDVKNIRTLNKNENTGAYRCAADFILKINGQTQTLPIIYTSELLDNGNEFYVNVFGF